VCFDDRANIIADVIAAELGAEAERLAQDGLGNAHS